MEERKKRQGQRKLTGRRETTEETEKRSMIRKAGMFETGRKNVNFVYL